jgi:uncharacterized C2H2 Zn-finger protein
VVLEDGRGVCTLCRKHFKNQKSVREHVAQIHSVHPLIQCAFCKGVHRGKKNFHMHMTNSHSVRGERQLSDRYGKIVGYQ